MENETVQPEVNPIPPHQSNAVSLYGQSTDAMDDFPVLKAFQQYVDAEQAKAHKRLMTVCAFFAVLMAIVVGVFVYIIIGLNKNAAPAKDQDGNEFAKLVLDQQARQNEQLMAQLLAPKPAPAANPAAPTGQPTVQDLLLQKQMMDQQRLNEQLMTHLITNTGSTAPTAPTGAATPAVQSPSANADLAKEKEALEQRERKLNAQEKRLEAEKAKVAKDAEQVKAERIDLQNHRNYPDAFSAEAREKANQDVKKAQEDAKRAEDEKRELIKKTTEAERKAHEAVVKAEDEARATLLENARLKKEMERLAKENESLKADAEINDILAPVNPTPVVDPEEKDQPAVQPQPVVKPVEKSVVKPVVKPVEKLNKSEDPETDKFNPVKQLDGTFRFFEETEEDSYDIPLS